MRSAWVLLLMSCIACGDDTPVPGSELCATGGRLCADQACIEVPADALDRCQSFELSLIQPNSPEPDFNCCHATEPDRGVRGICVRVEVNETDRCSSAPGSCYRSTEGQCGAPPSELFSLPDYVCGVATDCLSPSGQIRLAGALSPALVVNPAGTHFAMPISVELPVSGSTLTPDRWAVFRADGANGAWFALEGSAAMNVARGTTTQTGVFVVRHR